MKDLLPRKQTHRWTVGLSNCCPNIPSYSIAVALVISSASQGEESVESWSLFKVNKGAAPNESNCSSKTGETNARMPPGETTAPKSFGGKPVTQSSRRDLLYYNGLQPKSGLQPTSGLHPETLKSSQNKNRPDREDPTAMKVHRRCGPRVTAAMRRSSDARASTHGRRGGPGDPSGLGPKREDQHAELVCAFFLRRDSVFMVFWTSMRFIKASSIAMYLPDHAWRSWARS